MRIPLDLSTRHPARPRQTSLSIANVDRHAYNLGALGGTSMWIVWAISALSAALVAASVFLCCGDSEATPRRAPFLGLAALGLGLLPQTAAPEQAGEKPPGLVLQTGHAKKVSRLLFSPDGRWLATSSHDRTIKLWDASLGLELRTLSGHSDSVRGLAVSPDGGLLASAGDDFAVRLWDVRTGHQVQSLSGHSAAVTTVAFSPDGDVLASGGVDGELRLWELATGRLLRSTQYPDDSLISLEFSPNGRFLASGGQRGQIRVREVEDGCGEISLRTGLQLGSEPAFSGDSRRLAAADGNGVRLWSLPDGQTLRSLPGAPFSNAVFSPDGSWIAVAQQRQVTLWETATGVSKTLSGHQSLVQSIAFDRDGRRVVSADRSGSVRVWDLDTGKQLLTLGDSLGSPTTLAASPNNRLLAVGTASGTVRIWKMPSRELLHDLRLFQRSTSSDGVTALAFDASGKWLAMGQESGVVSLWEPDSGRLVRQLPQRSSPVDFLAFESEATLVAVFRSGAASRLRAPSGCEIGSASLEELPQWDLRLDHLWRASGRKAGVLSFIWHAGVGQTAEHEHLDSRAAAVGPAGRRLAWARFGWLSLKDRNTGERLWRVRPFDFEAVDAVAFDLGGRRLAAAGDGGSLTLRDAASGRELWGRNGLGKPVSSLVFSEDQSWLATVTGEGRLSIWEVETGRELGVIDDPATELPSQITSATFSPDGELLVIAGDEGIELRARANGQLQRRLAFFGAEQLAWSPDGRLLAASGRDSVGLWRMPGAAELRRFSGEFGQLAFSPDGRTLAALTLEGNAVLWDVATGDPIRELGDRLGAVLPPLFSPDGKRIVLASSIQLQVWDAVAGILLSELPLNSEDDGVAAVHFGPSGEALSFVDFNGVVKLWRIGAETTEILGTSHRQDVVSLRFHPKGDWLATAGSDGAIQLWDPETGRLLKRLAETGGDGSLAVDPEGRRLAAFEANLRIWEVSTGRLIAESPTTADRTQQITAATRSPNGRWIAVSTPGGVQLWEVESGRMVHALSGTNGAFSPDGSRVATFEEEGPIRLWDVNTGRPIDVLEGRSARFTLFDPTWKLAASLRSDGTVELWEISSGEVRHRLSAGEETGSSAAVVFSPAGDLLAVGGWETTSVWDTQTGRLKGALPTDGYTHAVAFSPDGRRLATSGSDAEIRIWEAGSWRQLASLDAGTPIDLSQLTDQVREVLGMVGGDPSAQLRLLGGGGQDFVGALAFSPEGDRLAYGKELGGVIGVWDFAGSSRNWEAHTEAVTTVTFGPGEAWLMSAGLDGSVRIWNPETQSLQVSLVSAGGVDEWLVIAPDGLFDGSPEAWRRILWRFRGDTFDTVPVEQFFTDFFRPGLFAEVLAGRPPKAPRRIARLDRRQPRVELDLTDKFKESVISERTATLRINVAEASGDPAHTSGSGVRDLRLFRNGTLVRAWRGALGGESGQAEFETSVALLAGENLFTAYAFNRDNIKSADSTLRVEGHPRLARPGSLHILAIGINRYANPALDLRFAVADADEFSGEVRRRQLQLDRFQSVNVISLRDQEATKANILGALERLASGSDSPDSPAVQPEDVVVLFYAGHGTAGGERFYLIPHEASWGREEQAISDRELDRVFEGIDAGVFLVVIDACNSGQLLESEERRRGPLNSKGLAQLAYEKGMFVLTAAQSYQAALEADELGHGFLTHVLVEEGLKAMRADSDPADGRLLLREWLEFAASRVPEMQAERMRLEKGRGRDLAFVEGEQSIADPADRSLQRPRAYYRREFREREFVVASSSPTGAKDQ